jgi:hypothetical protein
MPRNVVDDEVVDGGGGGVEGAGTGTGTGAVVVTTAGRDGLAVLSVDDGGGGVGDERKFDCTIC